MEENYHQPPLQPQTPIFKHKLNKVNIVMAILLILALAAAITFAILWATKKTDAPAENNNAPSAEATQASSATDCPTATTDQQSSDKECACPELTFSNEAVVNKQENTIYSANTSASAYTSTGTAVTVGSNFDKTARVWIYWNELNSMFNPSEEGSSQAQNYEISFSENIVDIFFAAFGQSVSHETFLFLLEDGTVEYMPLLAVAKTKEVKSYGKLPLSNVKKFYRGSSGGTNGRTGGGAQSFAQTSDGKIYQLYTILNEAGAWN